MSLTIKTKPPRKKKPAEYQEWAVLRDEWIVGQLIGGMRALTLKEFALKKGLAPQSVLNKSSTMKWGAELNERRKANDEAVTSILSERSTKAIEEVQAEFVGREASIRRRHAQISRGLQAKAMQKLAAIDPGTLSVKEAIAMLSLGLTEERFAMGMQQTYEHQPGADPQHAQYQSVVKQNENHKKIQALAVQMLQKLQEKGLSTEAVIIDEIGLGTKASEDEA